MTVSQTIATLIVPFMLAGAGWCDVKHYRIPNAYALILLGLYAALLAGGALGWTALPPWPADLTAAGLGFLVCFALFAGRLLGGGDAKLIPAVLLWVPAGHALTFVLAMTLSGAAVALWKLQRCRALVEATSEPIKNTENIDKIPYALPIFIGYCFTITEPFLNVSVP